MAALRVARGTILLLLLGCTLAACGRDADPESVAHFEERFTPGLHTMMSELAARHASTWFAGDAQNWPLVDYMLHELEETVHDIGETHPRYEDVAVAEMLDAMTAPALAALAAAVDASDRAAFTAGYDRLTAACNQCHTAAGRGAIVIQRPTAPPLSNIRYSP